jgi:hypothetical protein
MEQHIVRLATLERRDDADRELAARDAVASPRRRSSRGSRQTGRRLDRAVDHTNLLGADPRG